MESKWRLDQKSIRRAYAMVSPVYDLLYDRIFYPGRVEAVKLLEVRPEEKVLEVGIGTGLTLPLYPRHCRLVGVDLSAEMLKKARVRVQEFAATHVHLVMMDAMRMGFPDNVFDHVLAAYVISAVPDPVQVLNEIRRVCRPGGHIVILNHFKSEHPFVGALEEIMAPIITRIGLFKPDLQLPPLLERVGLIPEQIHRVNILNGWRLIRCTNHKPVTRSAEGDTHAQ
jgi:phosphatidylethanolamine/phosphatidyl-N-methylethanolamine N-methyltransferase